MLFQGLGPRMTALTVEGYRGHRGGEVGHGEGCEASVGQPLHCYSDVPALPWALGT